MGYCCTKDFYNFENKIVYDIMVEKGKYEEVFREDINNNKSMI